MIAFIESIRLDKWLHCLGSVVIFAAVHYVTGNPPLAFGVAVLAHVVKKAYDVEHGSRDWNDVAGDIGFGVAGALLAWACLIVRV